MDQIRTPPNPAESSSEQPTQEELSHQATGIQPPSASLPAETQEAKHIGQTTKESAAPTASTPTPTETGQVVSNTRDQAITPIKPSEAAALFDGTNDDNVITNQANKVTEMFNIAIEQPDAPSSSKEAA